MEAGGEFAFQEARRAAKEREPDRYVASLLAPRARSSDLIALAALSAEVQKIIAQVSEPSLGEIRLQWLREAVASPAGASGNPIVDLAAAAVRRTAIPRRFIDDFIDGSIHRLYADPPADDNALRLELEMIEGAQFNMALRALGFEETDVMRELCANAAQSYGLARIGLDLPYALARGRNPLPAAWSASGQDWRMAIRRLCAEAEAALNAVRTQIQTSHAPVLTAFLPLAVVEPYLAALQKAGRDLSREVAEIPPLRRFWRISCAAALRRL